MSAPQQARHRSYASVGRRSRRRMVPPTVAARSTRLLIAHPREHVFQVIPAVSAEMNAGKLAGAGRLTHPARRDTEQFGNRLRVEELVAHRSSLGSSATTSCSAARW